MRSNPPAIGEREKTRKIQGIHVHLNRQKAISRAPVPLRVEVSPMIRSPERLPVWAETGPKTSPALVRAVLTLLAKSRRYAASARCDEWQYAEELVTLRATGASHSDLRWLLQKGYVSHREEMTRRGSPSRVFRKLGPLELRERACFVITDSGETLLRRSREAAVVTPAAGNGS